MTDPSERRFLQLGQICAGVGSSVDKLAQITALGRGSWEEEWMRVAAVATVTDPTTVAIVLGNQLREGVFLVFPEGGKGLAVMEASRPIRESLVKTVAEWRGRVSPGKSNFGDAKGFSCRVIGFPEDLGMAYQAIRDSLGDGWQVDMEEDKRASAMECLGFVNELVERFDPGRKLGPVRERGEEESRFQAALKGKVMIDPLVLSALRR